MNRKNNRRGFTLVELSIVLAVLAIVSTMVVSFTTMVSGSGELSSARLDALGDVRVAEALIENFIEENEIATKFTDDDGNAITITTLTAQNGNTLSFEKEGEQGGTLTTHETSIALESVTEITFDTHGAGDVIYYCTVVYEVRNHEYRYTFCVNPYAGESIESIKEVTDSEQVELQ